jgi:hypothetical protein
VWGGAFIWGDTVNLIILLSLVFNMRFKNLHFGISRSEMVDMTTIKNATSRPILKELRISKRHPEARTVQPKTIPKIVNLAIDEERRCYKSSGDQSAETEMQRFPPVIVVGEAGPILRPTVGGTEKASKLFATRVATKKGHHL